MPRTSKQVRLPRAAGGALALPVVSRGPRYAWQAAPLLAVLMLAVLMLAACGSGAEPDPRTVTAGEARALDKAAEMLDEQRLPTPLPPTPTASATVS